MLKFVRKRPCIQQQLETTKQPRRRRSDDDDDDVNDESSKNEAGQPHCSHSHKRRNTCASSESAKKKTKDRTQKIEFIGSKSRRGCVTRIWVCVCLFVCVCSTKENKQKFWYQERWVVSCAAAQQVIKNNSHCVKLCGCREVTESYQWVCWPSKESMTERERAVLELVNRSSVCFHTLLHRVLSFCSDMCNTLIEALHTP